MSRITTILWDVDGTLVDFNESEKASMRQCLEKYGVSVDEKQLQCYHQCNRSYWKQFEKKEIPKTRVYIGRFEDFFRYLNVEHIDPQEFNEAFQKALADSVVLYDYALELCTALSKTYRQYVVTNGSMVAQNGKLRRSGLSDLMDGIFISEEMGTEKPSKTFFNFCAERIPNYCTQETMVIGDSLTSDMAGGNNAGIICCWYNPSSEKVPSELHIDYNIGSLREFEIN